MQVQQFWREVTAGFVLLVAMESVMGSLPVAASQARLLDGNDVRTPTRPLRLILPPGLPDQAGTGPRLKPEVTQVAEGISPPDGGTGQLQLQVTSTLPGAGPPGPTPAKIVATLQTGSLMARVGPQALSYDSLIHKDRTEPGAVVALGLGTRTLVKGFGVQSGEGHGYQRLLGSDRASYAFNGVVAEHKLPAPEGGDINLVAAWLSGAAHAAGTVEETGQHAGDAWSVSADTALLKQRMQLRFEYAGSSFDWQHAGKTGRAYSFGTEFRSAKSSSITWHLGTEFDQVAPRFGSLANPTLESDWRRLRTYGALSAGEWKFDLSLGQRQSNLEDTPATPTVQRQNGQFTAAWTPSPTTEGLFSGRPSYELTADYGQSNRIVEAPLSESGQQRDKAFSLMLQTEFTHADWLWGVRAKGAEMPGKEDANESRGARTLALHLYGDLAAKRLRPTVSWQRLRDHATGSTDERWRAGLDSSDIALRDNLTADVKLAYQQRFRSDGGKSDKGYSLGGNLAWQLRRAAEGHSGLLLAFSGSYLGGDPGLTSPAGGGYRFMLSLSTDTSHQ
ncbi:MAG: hypothetical protein WBM59_07165 [Sedimenticolaceae bacterium]